MKSLLWVLALLTSLALLPMQALADLPAPKSTPESPISLRPKSDRGERL